MTKKVRPGDASSRFYAKASFVVFSTILFCFTFCCRRGPEPLVALLETASPLRTYGSENSGHYDKAIDTYTVDQNGRVYLWDATSGDHIDVYGDDGQFLFQFGRKGQGPGEFQAVSALAVDAEGDLWISDGIAKSLKIFSDQGEFKVEVLCPKELADSYIQKMTFDAKGDLLLLCSYIGNGNSLFRFDIRKNNCQQIHSESKRIKASLANFRPDFALDAKGNIFIIDTVDYRIYKYANDGRLSSTFEDPDFRKELILEEDFNIFADSDFKIIRFPAYKEILDVLRGPSRYFPAVFGINVDLNTIYAWTSKQDQLKRFFIDIYDMNFQKIGSSCYFNYIRHNLAQIINGKLYIPGIENDNIQVTKKAGRLTMLNFSDQLNVYAISTKIREVPETSSRDESQP